MNISLRDQVKAMVKNTRDAALCEVYPFVRHDKAVRAKVLSTCADGSLLIATTNLNDRRQDRLALGQGRQFLGARAPRAYNLPPEATIRHVSAEYFDNNYWEGLS